MITKTKLHKVEMDLINKCEDNEVMKEIIITAFTDLMQETGLSKEQKAIIKTIVESQKVIYDHANNLDLWHEAEARIEIEEIKKIAKYQQKRLKKLLEVNK